MQYAPTIFTTMLSFLHGNANNYLCKYLCLKWITQSIVKSFAGRLRSPFRMLMTANGTSRSAKRKTMNLSFNLFHGQGKFLYRV